MYRFHTVGNVVTQAILVSIAFREGIFVHPLWQIDSAEQSQFISVLLLHSLIIVYLQVPQVGVSIQVLQQVGRLSELCVLEKQRLEKLLGSLVIDWVGHIVDHIPDSCR